ncbi:hypothetical protein B0G73_109262 [Paraburkholderia sp. BL25I1N1]|nr:hypothetical protein B0G73_109262 [Paraburkholderia sp. BL25I1N1]
MHIVLRELVIEPRMPVKQKKPGAFATGLSFACGTLERERDYCTDTVPKFWRPNGLT